MKNIRTVILEIITFLQKHGSRKNENFHFYLLIFIALVVFLIAVNLFVELTDEITGKTTQIFDHKITDYVLSFRTPALTQFFVIITDLGKFYAYLVMTILVSIFLFLKFRHWKFILQLLAITILSALSNVGLKRFIGRARPGIEHLVSVETLSYPSGHAMSVMAFYGFLIYLAFQIKMAHWLRWLLCIIFSAFIFLVGLSRIYLGVHFPSDIAGGFIAGLIWVTFCIVLFNITVLFRKRKAKTHPDEDVKEIEN